MFIRVDRNNHNNNSVFKSYHAGDIDLFCELIDSGHNINCLDKDCSLISCIVANSGSHDDELNKKFFDKMIEADVHLGGIGDELPLLKVAIDYPKDTYYMSELLKKGIPLEYIEEKTSLCDFRWKVRKTGYEQPIFHLLKEYNKEENQENLTKIKLLLDYNINLKKLSNNNEPVLNFIISYKEKYMPELIELFLKHGADPNDIDEHGESTLHKLAQNCTNIELFELLIENNADMNKKNKSGYTPINIAAYYGNITAVKFFVDKGANTKECNNDGMPPIMNAAVMENYTIFEFLSENTNDISIQDKNGDNALHHIARNCCADELKGKRDELMAKYAELMNVRNTSNKTAKDIIRSNMGSINHTLGF